MVSTVGTRPNHYETLGVAPGASGEEIARAFAREISLARPRAFGGMAEVSLAYAVLRDPAKRRAYDESLGLAAKAPPAPPTAALRIGAPFLSATAAAPIERRAAGPVTPHRAPQQPPAATRTAAFIAASLRDLADPAPLERPSAAPRPQPDLPRAAPAETKPRVDPPAARADRLEDAEEVSIDWRRTGIGAGALVAVAVLTGAWAGIEAGNDMAQQPEQEVKVTLPPAKPLPAMAAARAAPARSVEQARPEPRLRPAAAAAPVEREPSLPPRALTAQELDELAPVEVRPVTSAVAEATAEPAVAEPAPVAAAAASIPLPSRTIARTIERIGYSCGEVASTSAVEGGGAGVFKVTCTSGSAYQARPVNGRYRFRRWGRN